MKPKGYLGLDVGGTGAKAGVIDQDGRLLGMALRRYRPQLLEGGRVEISIDTIYEATREAAVAAVRASGADVGALSIASQGQTFVSLDQSGKPLHPAIVWYDARASQQSARLQQSLRSAHLPQAEMPGVMPIAAAPKIMWLREHFPALMAQARHYFLLPDYLAFRLTGRAVTDPSTASSTALYAGEAGDYCEAALVAAGIAREQVAEVRKPGQPIGRVLPESAQQWGLSGETLVVTGTNDQYAGALGAGNCRPGIVSVTTGTCLALVTLVEHLPQPMPPGLLGGRFPIARYHFALAFSKTAGVVLEWFNRELSPDKNLHELDDMASQVPLGSRGIIMLPHFDGMISPVPDENARGGFLQLSLHHTRADMYRATLEALGYNLQENLQLFQQAGLNIQVVRAIGGGAKSDFWLQTSADIIGFPVERPRVPEAAVLGAAMIAAVGSGAFSSLEESSGALYRPERVFSPDKENHTRYEKLCESYIEVYRQVYRQRG